MAMIIKPAKDVIKKSIEQIYEDLVIPNGAHEVEDVRFLNQRILSTLDQHRDRFDKAHLFLMNMVREFQKSLHKTEGELNSKIRDLRSAANKDKNKLNELGSTNADQLEEISELKKSYASIFAEGKKYIRKCTKLEKELKEAMKIIKAQKAAGSTINQDCMTGACEGHRKDLAQTNIEYYGEIYKLKQKLYMSWIGFGITGALLIFFRYLLVDLIK